MANDVQVTGNRKDRYDLCRIPHEELNQDPHVILVAVREMFAMQQRVGDLIVIACPPDSTHGPRGLLAKVQKALEAER